MTLIGIADHAGKAASQRLLLNYAAQRCTGREPARGVARDDIDSCQERIGAVQRGQRSFRHLNVIDCLHGNVLGTNGRRQAGAEGHLGPVDHDLEDAGSRTVAARHPAHADRWLDQVADDVQAEDVGQHLGKRAPSVQSDFVRADRLHVGRSHRAALLDSGAGGHHHDVEQVLQTQILEILRRRVCGRWAFLSKRGHGKKATDRSHRDPACPVVFHALLPLSSPAVGWRPDRCEKAARYGKARQLGLVTQSNF